MTEPFVTAPSQGVPLALVQVAVHVSADAPAGSRVRVTRADGASLTVASV